MCSAASNIFAQGWQISQLFPEPLVPRQRIAGSENEIERGDKTSYITDRFFLVNNLKKKGNTLHGYITGKILKKPRKEIKPTVQRSVTIGAKTRDIW